ncbi:MAG: DUF4043 family protein [Candidatus Didemnitutus sp.]|nr:DUF4043 family protein [Candidatus Didemnitutus sp.]
MSITNPTSYQTLVAANADIRATVWSRKVLKTVDEKSVFKNFRGGEGSKMPVVNKQDLSAGQAQDVVFTLVSAIRGQGVRGEQELKTKTAKIKPHTFRVRVDLMRHAISWTQILKKLRMGGTVDQITSDLMGDWYTRKYDDDIQIRLRNHALLVAPGTNLLRVTNGHSGTTRDQLRSTDTLTPSFIDNGKSTLLSMGASELGMETDQMGATIPKYLFFGPETFLSPLRSNSSYLQGMQYGALRGEGNPLFTGKYPLWNNNVIYPHNIKQDDADGRQGSPFAPVAYLGTAIADTTPTTVTGGGTTDAAGDSDYFAYFPGYSWFITENESLPSDSNDYYFMIYNHRTDKKYEIVKYTAAGVHADAKQIASVTRGSATQTGGTNGGGNVTAQAAGRFSLAHPSGAIIIPCTREGVPINWAMHTGGEALFYATGSEDARPIVHTDDFHVVGKPDDAHLKAFGLQGIRGMSVFTDRRALAKNFVIVEGAATVPGVVPVAFTG